jgi:hypothetical protein
MLVIPNQYTLNRDEVKIIAGFVEKGGILLSTFKTGVYREDGTLRKDFALGEITGALSFTFSPYSVDYIDGLNSSVSASLPSLPLLISPSAPPIRTYPRSDEKAGLLVQCRDAEVLGTITHPSCERSEEEWVSHSHANPKEKTGYPALIFHRYGEGKSLYIPMPIFRSYGASPYSLIRELLINLLDYLEPEPTVRIQAPLGVEVTCMRKGGKTILALVNLPHGELARELKNLQEALPIADIRVKLKARNAGSVVLPLSKDETDLAFERSGEYISFTIPKLHIMQIVVVE